MIEYARMLGLSHVTSAEASVFLIRVYVVAFCENLCHLK